MNKAYVYILCSDEGRYYVGSTLDLHKRLKQHESGHTHTTNRMKNPELVFSQIYSSLEEARTAERKIKSWKRKDFIDKIIKDQNIRFKPT